jgi:rubrerythrin
MTFSWIISYEHNRCPKCWGTGYISARDKTNGSNNEVCPLCKGIVKIKPYQKINMKGK